MKRRIIFSLITLLLCQVLSAQTYHFQYSHDTLGNRVSRVYQGTNPSKGNVSGTVKGSPANQVWTQEDHDEDHDPAERPSNQYSEKDTVKISPFIKTQAEKDAYQDSMMAEVMRLQPLPVGRDTRDMTDYSVGAIPLEYGVSGSGARTYSVPIFTAPDVKYAPSLSLVYNSQGGRGLGGYGWDLAGISSITLVAKSKYWDDDIRAPSAFNTDGAFCLDGVRLVSNDDPATSSSYPFVTASGHILVKPLRGASGYIISFTVLYPDGSVAVFGTSYDFGFTLIDYPIVNMVSIEGYRIEYSYDIDYLDGRHILQEIRYGFDSSGNASCRTTFVYTGNNNFSYYAGKKNYFKPCLAYIQSYSGSTALYTYNLSHQACGDADLLRTISIMNASGEFLPPLTFSYGVDNPPHHGADSLKITGGFLLYSPTAPFLVTKSVYRRGKFVRGAYNDGVVRYTDSPIYSRIRHHEYICNYPASAKIYMAPSLSDPDSVQVIDVGSGFQTIEAVDVDGDGVDELVKVRCGALTTTGSAMLITTYRFNPDSIPKLTSQSHMVLLSGFLHIGADYSPYLRSYRWGDFLGNGKAQLLVVSYTDNGFEEPQTPWTALIDLETGTLLSEYQTPVQIASDQDQRLVVTDTDGDGRTELCLTTDTGLDVYRCNSNYEFVYEKHYLGINHNFIDSERTFFADINADGYVDIIKAPSTGNSWVVRYNTGISFIYNSVSAGWYNEDHEYMFIDIDRDGYPDLVERDGTSLGIYRNIRGMGFSSYAYLNTELSNISAYGSMLPSNIVRRNAMSCFVWLDGFLAVEYGYTSYVPELRHLVQSRDSYGKIVRNTYGYLPQSSLYWTGNTSVSAADGYQLRVLPIYVLTGAKGFMSETATTPSGLQESYSWYDGVVHTRGLGFCGFAKTQTVSNLEAVLKRVSTFNPQKRGVPVSVTLYSGAIHPAAYSIVNYTYDDHFTDNCKLQPRLTQTVVTKAIDGVLSTTLYTYDNFDFPIKVVTTKSGGTFTSCPSVVQTEYTHSNNPSRYVLGVVASQTTLSSKTLGTPSAMGTQKVFTYDTLFRPVRCETYSVTSTVPAHVTTPNYWTLYHASTDRWQYDCHGNVTREESAPSGSSLFTGTSYSYDASGRHMLSATDALGHTTAYSGFDQYGNPSIVTNYKGQQTHSYRDGWGRVTRTVHPDGTVDSLARAWGGSGVYKETSISSGAPDVVVDYDAAGREVLSQNKRFNGQWQKVATQYNKRGLTYKVSQPYRGSSASYWSTYLYDDYGRLVSITEPSGRKTTRQYSGTTVTETKDKIKVIRKTDLNGALYTVSDSLGTYTYNYRDDGQPASISSPSGVLTTFTYDTLGRRTSITDPSAGTRNTAYSINANGSSSITETNALGSITTGKDSLGRVISIVRPDFNTTFTYDTCGRLVSKVSTNGTAERYTYDAYDRLLTAKDSVPDGKWLQKTYTYNANGDVATIAYTAQGGYITTETYDYTNGTNTAIRLPDNTYVYQLTAENDLGQPTAATSGGVTRTYGYTEYGMPTYRKLNNGALMDHSYTFDATTGNLLSRSRTYGGNTTTENFSYDNLGRLTSATGNNITYDANNNITSIGVVGTMSYGSGAHPYRITDLYANSTSGTGTAQQTVTYTAYDRPSTISQGDKSAVFTYNADHDRVKTHITRGSENIDRYYIGGRYEINADEMDGTSEWLYLGGDAYSAPMILFKGQNWTTWQPYVIGRDYLGSINVLAISGAMQSGGNFDAWGKGYASFYINRGWCGHEHLEDFGLINMNARLYDPALGRFLSPDPYIQAPDFPGNFNRYAYCLNNPLKYNDRTGELFGIDDAILIAAASAIIGGAIGGYQGYKLGKANGATGDEMFGYIYCGVLIGCTSAMIGGYVGAAVAPMVAAAGYGGFLGGALTGAFSGAAAGAANGLGFGALSTGTIGGALNAGAQGMALGILSGAVVGGAIQGIATWFDGRNFWTGHPNRPTIELSKQTIGNDRPLTIEEPTIPKASDLGSFPDELSIRHDVEASKFDLDRLQQLPEVQRPSIAGYKPSLNTKTDLFHKTPILFDETIIQYGAAYSKLSDGSLFFVYPGTINNVNGVYTIGINNNNIIFHSCFYEFKP